MSNDGTLALVRRWNEAFFGTANAHKPIAVEVFRHGAHPSALVGVGRDQMQADYAYCGVPLPRVARECDRCGVARRLTDVAEYIRGYVAAGGKATDVMPDCGDEKREEEP